MCLFFWTAGETIVIWGSEINPFFEKLIRCCVLSRLSDDKSFPETFWVVCQMTNRPQMRFEPFVGWQIVPRDVLSHLSDDKLPSEAFWDERPLHLKKNDDLRVSLFWSFCLKGYFYGLPRWRSQWRVWGHWIATLRSQWRVWGHWIATLTLAMMGLVHEFTKVFSPARG